ncbi:MAG: XRE family transcriptional regulator [Firmicutes bacterium]|nr:XRE family transcriptional regulator [Bacillota bacterium]
MKFLDIFTELCEEKGVSPSTAAKECGLGNSTYSYWKATGTVPRDSTLNKIADYFDVPVARLKGKEPLDDWTVSFLSNLRDELECVEPADAEAACVDLDRWNDIALGYIPLTFSEACDIADALGDSVDRMIGMEKNGDLVNGQPLDDYEKRLISLFRETSITGRLEMINKFMEVVSKENAIARTAQMTLPHVGLKASAGIGESLLNDDDTQDWTVEVNAETRKADFCVTIHGDSMKPTYRDGDIALVRQQPSVEVGEVGIFALNGEGYIKKLGRGELVSLNTLYRNISFGEDDEIRCFGKVVGILDEDWIVER